MSITRKPVIIICPNLRCRSVLQVSEDARGRKVRCGHCGTPFVVPARQAAPVAPPAEAAQEPARKK